MNSADLDAYCLSSTQSIYNITNGISPQIDLKSKVHIVIKQPTVISVHFKELVCLIDQSKFIFDWKLLKVNSIVKRFINLCIVCSDKSKPYTVKPVLSGHSKRKPKIVFQDQL